MEPFAFYHCVNEDALVLRYAEAVEDSALWGAFYRELYQAAARFHWQDYLWERYLFRLVLTAENVFTRAAASPQWEQMCPAMEKIAAKELTQIRGGFPLPNLPQYQWERALAESFSRGDAVSSCREEWLFQAYLQWESAERFLSSLLSFHQRYGYGELALIDCWVWRQDLLPVENPDGGKLSEIIGYERQKQAVLENTEILLRGLPANHLLLYGERGTGKSSLVKAVAAHYGEEKLKLVEVHRSALWTIGDCIERIKGYPYTFILFLDDLSFEDGDEAYQGLKNLLDGGVKALPEHMVIYATSNRKHLVKETWQERGDEGEISRDGMAEKLSLAHRFGKTITFTAPTQEEYLEMVEALAAQLGIAASPEEVKREALLWERRYHSRSGRTAVQFVRDFRGREQLRQE